MAKQENKKNIVVTIHSPDKIQIRSRHALSCYCVENQIDICEFGDLKFFYNPNYTPAVEPNAMDRTTLKRLNVKRKNVDSNYTIEEPSSAKMSKTNAQIVPITGVTKTFEIEAITDVTNNLEIQPLTEVLKSFEIVSNANVTKNLENQPATTSDVTNNDEIEHTANETIRLEIEPTSNVEMHPASKGQLNLKANFLVLT